jgi:hypothetical protein
VRSCPDPRSREHFLLLREEQRGIAGRSRVGAETRGAQQRRVCGVQLCSKNGSGSQSGALDCVVQLASASELDLAADRAHTGGASRGRARASNETRR